MNLEIRGASNDPPLTTSIRFGLSRSRGTGAGEYNTIVSKSVVPDASIRTAPPMECPTTVVAGPRSDINCSTTWTLSPNEMPAGESP